jgi:predicted Na+-dependent transporter
LIAVILLVAHAAQQREAARVERVVVFSWLAFTLLPLLAFVIVQTSKLPAMFGVVGVLLLWTLATGTVAQQIAATEAATRPARAEMPPWYVVWERRRVETR